jgi:hypothetical protein
MKMEQKNFAGAYPSGADAHVNVPLSNFASEAFDLNEQGYVAPMLLPAIGVDKQSNKYYTIRSDEFFRAPSTGTLRAPKTSANKVEFTISSDSYFADNYALAVENALEDLDNADLQVRLRENSVRLISNLLMLDQEVRVANMVTSISNVGSGVALAGNSKWGDPNSDPIGDVNTAHAFIRSNTALTANTAVIDWDTIQVVRRHPAMLDLFKYNQTGELKEEDLKSLFKVDRLLVAKAIKNVGKEGQVNSMGNVWGNLCLLAYVGTNTGLQSITFGGRFRWQPPIFPADFGVTTNVYNQAGSRHVETVEAGYFQDEKIIARGLSYLIKDTI